MRGRLRQLLQPEAKFIADPSADNFAKKVENIQSSPVDITRRLVPEPLVAFDPVTIEEVTLLLKKAKYCDLDSRSKMVDQEGRQCDCPHYYFF